MDEKALQNLLDRQAILDCLARYCRAVDRRDRELLLSTYHPDAIDDHGPLVGSAEDLHDWGVWRDRNGPVVATNHHITTHNCEIVGDTAHTETYYLFTARQRDGTAWLASGRYLDRFERRNGEWKVAYRYCLMESSGMLNEGPQPFAGIEDLHASGVPGRNRQDPCYSRPLVNKRARRMPEMA